MGPRRRLSSLLLALVLAWVATATSRAIEIFTSTGNFYNNTNNISASDANWSGGWGEEGIDGWDYEGVVASKGSAIYLGNGWVLTAGHIGNGDFVLDGNTYEGTGLVDTNFSVTQSGTTFPADLNLFQISTVSTTGTQLTLPPLQIATFAPAAFSNVSNGSQVVMIGYGSPGGESWGINTVTDNNTLTPVNQYVTVDFYTRFGPETASFDRSIDNQAEVIGGDSGGGDFVFSNGNWYLVGLNEANNASKDSVFVQLNAYRDQIDSFMLSAVPEPGDFALLGVALAVLIAWKMRRRRRAAL